MIGTEVVNVLLIKNIPEVFADELDDIKLLLEPRAIPRQPVPDVNEVTQSWNNMWFATKATMALNTMLLIDVMY